MKGARGVLINVTGGPDLMLFEVEAAANRIRAEVDPDANIIFGSTIIDDMEGRIRVSVVATGMEAEMMRMPLKTAEAPRANIKPLPRQLLEEKIAAAGIASKQANPVHAQVDEIAKEMGATRAPATAMPAAAMTEAEEIILGGVDTPEIFEEEAAPIRPAQPIRPAATTAPMRPAPEPERRGWFGIGRRKAKAEEQPLRAEPQMQPRQAPQAQRAQAQVIGQQQPRAAQQAAPQAQQGDDLFGEHKGDEQFEIPAFLRRQQS
jgi:cell division protein FtsZ